IAIARIFLDNVAHIQGSWLTTGKEAGQLTLHEEAQLRGVPDALAPLVRACLAKDPEERPSTLQLSMRLKEIAAREAQGGLHGQGAEGRAPAQRERVEVDRVERSTGRLDDRTQRYTEAGGRGTGASASRPGGRGGSASRAGGARTGGSRADGSRTGSRTGGARGTASRSGRPGTRTGARTSGGGLRPANPRLLRQRLTVFVLVTLIVLLGIAAVKQF
ncbi:hypothetical protein ABZ726_34855, partial [Streptomyces hundungensis]